LILDEKIGKTKVNLTKKPHFHVVDFS